MKPFIFKETDEEGLETLMLLLQKLSNDMQSHQSMSRREPQEWGVALMDQRFCDGNPNAHGA